MEGLNDGGRKAPAARYLEASLGGPFPNGLVLVADTANGRGGSRRARPSAVSRTSRVTLSSTMAEGLLVGIGGRVPLMRLWRRSLATAPCAGLRRPRGWPRAVPDHADRPAGPSGVPRRGKEAGEAPSRRMQLQQHTQHADGGLRVGSAAIVRSAPGVRLRPEPRGARARPMRCHYATAPSVELTGIEPVPAVPPSRDRLPKEVDDRSLQPTYRRRRART